MIKKNYLKKCIGVIVTVILFGVLIGVNAQSPQSDLSDDLVRYIGSYVFNYAKGNPPKFEKIRWINIGAMPGDDEDDPKTDNKGVTKIDGYVETVDDERFRFKNASLRKNAEGNYESVEFETETLNGIRYVFKGDFLKKALNEAGEYTVLRGNLLKYKNGEVVANVYRAPFSKYAEL